MGIIFNGVSGLLNLLFENVRPVVLTSSPQQIALMGERKNFLVYYDDIDE